MTSETSPPPWLINMQRYGPPPAYPRLRIPGLNAPLPYGAQYGYQQGGWGKPPVDATGTPLYGDVFGTSEAPVIDEEEEEKKRLVSYKWGEVESDEEESDEDESEEEEGDEEGEGKEGAEEMYEPDMEEDLAGTVTPGKRGTWGRLS